MSSLQKTEAGYRIQFRLKKQTRQISLPGAKLRAAEIVQRNLNELLTSLRQRTQPHETTMVWADSLDGDLRNQLEDFGLIPPRPRNNSTIADLLQEFIEFREHLKDSTLIKYRQTAQKAKLYFRQRPLSSLSRADAEDFRGFLLRLNLGENTVRKTCGQLSTFVRWLQRRDLWTKANPFDGEVGAAKNKANLYLGYKWGAFNLTSSTTYIGESALDDVFLAGFDAAPRSVKIKEKIYNDFQLTYALRKEVDLYVGVDNAFDTKAPPIISGLPGSTTGAETDAGTYDPIGRRYYVGLRVKM